MLKPFDRLGERLLTAGIAPRHVRRYLTELNEHLDDLRTEEKGAGHDPEIANARALARLGTADDLAAAMAGRPEFRSWAAREPWAALVIFVIVPPLTLTLFFAMTVISVVLFVQSHRASPFAQPDLPGWFGLLSATMFRFESLVLPVLLGWGIAIVAIRQRLPSFWPIIGLAVIAVFGAASQLSITLPTAPAAHGEISFGMYLHGAEIYRLFLNLILITAPYLVWRHFIIGGQSRQS